MSAIVARMMALFHGLERAHGRYDVGSVDKAKLKVGGKARTVREPVTQHIWEGHLSGLSGIGIIPIRDDNTVRFGAIDIDVYDGLDLYKLRQSLGNLPLVVCRTKSGGAHLYLFCREDVPAKLVRTKLKEWATRLGYPRAEIFPKQDELRGEEDIGNWINMPYFDAAKTLRYAIGPEGAGMMIEAFLDYAESIAVTAADLGRVKPPPPRASSVPVSSSPDDPLDGAPPCLHLLAQNGIPEGQRNSAIYNFGVYTKYRYQEKMADALAKLNDSHCKPPLSDAELRVIVKSIERKSYNYKCKDEPICSLCDRALCLQRRYGVAGEGQVTFGMLQKIMFDAPVWRWFINGVPIDMTTEQFLSQRQVGVLVTARLSKIMPQFSKEDWHRITREAIAGVQEIEAFENVSLASRVVFYLEKRFLRVVKRDDQTSDPTYINGKLVFSPETFVRYLALMNFSEVSALTQDMLWNTFNKRYGDKFSSDEDGHWTIEVPYVAPEREETAGSVL